MTAALGNTSQGTPFATGVDAFVYPQFITANRAPTTLDIYNPGTRWQDNSTGSPVIYETTGAGVWVSFIASSFTSLTVVGPTTLTGTTNINTTGSAVTSIGTGGTGAVNIGNATGNTSITGTLTTSAGITATTGNLTLSGATSKINVSAAIPATASVGTTAALTAGAIVVSTSAITANSIVFFATHTLGTVTIPQSYRVSARTPGTSFTIQSSDATDTSTVDYVIIN